MIWTIDGVFPGLKGINPAQNVNLELISGLNSPPEIVFTPDGLIEFFFALEVAARLPAQDNLVYVNGTIPGSVKVLVRKIKSFLSNTLISHNHYSMV